MIFLCIFLSGCNGFSPIMPNVPSNSSECNICNLPNYPVSVKVLEGNSSYFLIELKDVGSGYDIYDGIWKGWCADNNTTVTLGEWYQGNIYCSYDPPCNLANIAWPKINWIINNKGLYGADYIQDSIWHFTNGISPNEWAEWAGFLAMNFCPNENQKYAAIIDIPGKQPTFIEVPVKQNNSVDNKSEYRLLSVGIASYSTGDNNLVAPVYDAHSIKNLYDNHKYKFSYNEVLEDNKATKSNILNYIDNHLANVADTNDISFFYFSGHAWGGNGSCFLDCYDEGPLDESIAVYELERHLSNIKGTVVVLIDSCASGGVISKKSQVDKLSYIELNKRMIDIFRDKSTYRDNLCQPKYQVLTSCTSNQLSEEIDPVYTDPFGYFTAHYRAGCGYDKFCYPCPANKDENPAVSLQEAYFYIKEKMPNYLPTVQQDVQVYPYGSDFSVMEY